VVPEPLRGQSFAVLELVFLGDKAAGDELTEPLRALRPVMDTIGMVPPAGIAGIDAFVAAAGPGSGSALVSAEIRHLGGALARPQAGQGSLGTLDCQFMTFGVGALAFEGAGTVHHRALERIAAALAPYDTGRQYLNFTEASTDPARFYRPDVFHRLRAVKAAYDPDNLFRANHPIPPASS
jgi:FAD/FMN-containing dehydrogenase